MEHTSSLKLLSKLHFTQSEFSRQKPWRYTFFYEGNRFLWNVSTQLYDYDVFHSQGHQNSIQLHIHFMHHNFHPVSGFFFYSGQWWNSKLLLPILPSSIFRMEKYWRLPQLYRKESKLCPLQYAYLVEINITLSIQFH